MRNLLPADKSWIVLWTWVGLYNPYAAIRRACGDDRYELMSMACDRYKAHHRWLTEVWLLAFYLHLSNRIPDRLDPIHWFNIAAHRILKAWFSR